MYILLIILTLICAILLICVVLIQKSKGGGLSSTFAGSNQIMGVRRTNNFIENMTWTLAGIICVLAVLTTFCMPNAISVNQDRVGDAPVEQQQGVDFGAPAQQAPAQQAPAQQAPAK